MAYISKIKIPGSSESHIIKDGNAVHLSGNETINGVKTFNSSPLVPNISNRSDSSTKAANTEFVNYHVNRLSGMMNEINIDGQETSVLNLIHISRDEYADLLEGKNGGILSDAVYFVSGDYHTIYGQQLKDVGEPTDPTDATTMQYVDNSINNLSSKYLTNAALTSYAKKENIKIGYNSSTKRINLSADGTVTYIDASNFIKDGMVSDVRYDSTTNKIIISFNTDAGKTPISVDVSNLVDTYTNGYGLSASNNGHTFGVNMDVISSDLSDVYLGKKIVYTDGGVRNTYIPLNDRTVFRDRNGHNELVWDARGDGYLALTGKTNGIEFYDGAYLNVNGSTGGVAVPSLPNLRIGDWDAAYGFDDVISKLYVGGSETKYQTTENRSLIKGWRVYDPTKVPHWFITRITITSASNLTSQATRYTGNIYLKIVQTTSDEVEKSDLKYTSKNYNVINANSTKYTFDFDPFYIDDSNGFTAYLVDSNGNNIQSCLRVDSNTSGFKYLLGSGSWSANFVPPMTFEYLKTLTQVDLNILSSAIPTKLSQLTNDSGYTKNTGTITGITMNGSSKGTSGVVNLGTVLTAHQSLAAYQTKTDHNTDVNNLSNAISSKIIVDDQYADKLYIKNISSEDYAKLLKNNTVLSNCVYVVSSENMDVYGQRIINVSDPVDLSDAVNLKYLQTALADSGNLSSYELKADHDREINAISAELSVVKDLNDYLEQVLDGNDDLATKTYVNQISANITNKIPTKVSDLANDSGYIPQSQKGIVNGLATLDATGKVPASQLPSYVDDIIDGIFVSTTQFKDANNNPITPETGKIYVDTTVNRAYRWNGSQYVVVGQTQVSFNELADKPNTLSGYGIIDASEVAIDNVKTKIFNVRHVSQEEYFLLLTSGNALANTLYVVSSDYLDAYEQQIKNVADPVELSDAVNLNYANTHFKQVGSLDEVDGIIFKDQKVGVNAKYKLCVYDGSLSVVQI